MATPAQGPMFFADEASDALLAYLIKSYTEKSNEILGRTILQKLCYFAKASGVPFPFRFEIYHYGPFSQEIFNSTENLLLDGVIEDHSSDRGKSNFVPGPNFDAFLDRSTETVRQYDGKLQRVATMFSHLDPSQMELVSTIHYIHSSYSEWFKKAPPKESVVGSVFELKGHKFIRQAVEKAYDILTEAGLLS